jgi:hypothetical protein
MTASETLLTAGYQERVTRGPLREWLS